MPNPNSQQLFTNNASTTLASAITTGATSIPLAAGTGALFPSPGTNQYSVATLTDAATGLLHEVVWVTGMSGDTATVVRAQEGTIALAWNAGDFFALLISAGGLQTFAQSVKQVLVPTTGFAITLPGSSTPLFQSVTILDPAGTLATGTLTMPATPSDGMRQRVSSSQTVTALTVSPGAGQTVKNAPTTLSAGTSFEYEYNAANTTWYRIG
jgi:hypothetical protein